MIFCQQTVVARSSTNRRCRCVDAETRTDVRTAAGPRAVDADDVAARAPPIVVWASSNPFAKHGSETLILGAARRGGANPIDGNVSVFELTTEGSLLYGGYRGAGRPRDGRFPSSRQEPFGRKNGFPSSSQEPRGGRFPSNRQEPLERKRRIGSRGPSTTIEDAQPDHPRE